MPVSASQLREVRATLDDITRLLEGNPEYASFVDELGKARDSFDEMVDDRGQLRESEGPKLGSRVKTDDTAESADRPGGANDPAKNFGGSRR